MVDVASEDVRTRTRMRGRDVDSRITSPKGGEGGSGAGLLEAGAGSCTEGSGLGLSV